MEYKAVRVGPVIRDIKRMLGEGSGQAMTLGAVSRSEQWDPFKILIATILSHRTKDEVTSPAANRLLSVYKDARRLARSDIKRIRELIKPVGFYRQKALRIKEVARRLMREFGGEVPDRLDELLGLPGVGRKTANCVLVYGFGRPAIPVDTHVHRITNRLGLVSTKTPEETELQLMKRVDKRHWLELNDILVRFGQEVCRPVKPRCEICLLKRVCRYYRTAYKLGS